MTDEDQIEKGRRLKEQIEPTAEETRTTPAIGPRGGRTSKNVWMRLVGMGLELAGITLMFTAFGYWIDDWRQADRPFVTALAMLVGFSLAMTRFIIVALKSGATNQVPPKRNEPAPFPTKSK
ncbi:hypothetical protein CA13_48850 [Planctomycetes bacterium CA13]|uniref:F0F1-ATPase subunit (ATPase_gene1) n=1 Tax=Novipirellula herctigrandis TaxID=2527986 RepID=A0A5C5Z892_9BACT|nr:hypothetical protein CA13_48850 [Planctomycetes bacterium CA13]